MLFEQLCRPLGRRHLPNPIGQAPLPIAQFEYGIVGPPHPLMGQYRQVFVFTDDQMSREAAVELPASLNKALLYLFSSNLLPLSLRPLSWPAPKRRRATPRNT